MNSLRNFVLGIALIVVGGTIFFFGCSRNITQPPLTSPSITNTPTNSPTPTYTKTYTNTITPTITYTPNGPTNTPTISPTQTYTLTPTDTIAPTNTLSPTPTPPPDPLLIDDMADGDNQVVQVSGRSGYWSTTADPYGSTVSPSTSGANTFVMSASTDNLYANSNYCARMTGTTAPFSTANYPYVAMEANFVPSGSYNISANAPAGPAITGVQFDMKAIITGDPNHDVITGINNVCFSPAVRFMIADGTTTTSSDANGVNLTPANANWNTYTVYFNQMMTTDIAVTDVLQTHVLDQTTAMQVQWEVTFPAANYDISVGNIRFITSNPPPAAVPPSWPAALIDNCEQNTNFALINSGRGGVWFNMADNSGNCPTNSSAYQDTICPINGGLPMIMSPGGSPASPGYCARITGTGMHNASPYPFPGMGVHFMPAIPDTSAGCPPGVGFDQPYNIQTSPGGSYTGFQFYAKVGAGSQTSVQVMGADATTDPNLQTPQCGTNTPGLCDATDWCNANHVKTITVTTSWVIYQVPFAQLVNPSWCTHNSHNGGAFDPTESIGIQWQLATGNYDFSVDDVSFY